MVPSKSAAISFPPSNDWRTSDVDEINKRRLRAREENFKIKNLDPQHPIFSNFTVQSPSGLTYSVEIGQLSPPRHACTCVDFRINGLGTCKHVEAVLCLLESRWKRLFAAAQKSPSSRFEVRPDSASDSLIITPANGALPAPLSRWFDPHGRLRDEPVDTALLKLEQFRQEKCPQLRISQEVTPWLESKMRAAERKQLRRDYELKVQNGEWPATETKVPLFPYQREGMLHLAFTERALLADEMGLGKTIQAIAACALLHRLGRAQRVLIVAPASLKTEWEEQIRRFTDLQLQLLFGSRFKRLAAYSNPPFFTIVNYEQMLADALDVNERLRPDVIVLDEAQRIKNWSTKTAQAIKRLRSRYAFVLTGTPIENRIDELHSLMDFIDPAVLGPLFRFNRDFFSFDDRGRPSGYRNLDLLHARIKPHLLRRRKAEVETELPERTDKNFFVPLSDPQEPTYAYHEQQVMKLVNVAVRRPLTLQEQEKLQRELAMMRMICDTNYILDPQDRVCPKLAELEKILEDCRENGAKAIIFSEWERMLELVRGLCQHHNIGFAWHTGSVPQQRRRAEINAFKSDPACRVFLSTDSGATGLNLQNATLVINCDLPWNPAKLEQRIARAWRKNQTKPVTVINLISENTIEHRMLATLAAKQTIADSVLDHPGAVKEIKISGGRQAFLKRLQQLVTPSVPAAPGKPAPEPAKQLPADRPLAFSQRAGELLQSSLLRCEERFPDGAPHSVLLVVVDRDPLQWTQTLAPVHRTFFPSDATDPLAPTQLEVIDRATDEAIERLVAAGLIRRNTRATRPLFPSASPGETPPLTDAERTQANTRREKARHTLRLAKLLGPAGFANETRAHLLDSLLACARALAIESRFPEPPSLADAFLPPLANVWAEDMSHLRAFASDATAAWEPVLKILETKLGSNAS